MQAIHDLKPSFNAGELSPRLAGRVDFAKFPSGLATLENLLPFPEGGVTRRPGSRYGANTKSAAVKGRLKRFQFSTTQAYIAEYAEQNIRFYRNQGQINSEDITASISNGDFTSNITNWNDISSGGGSISHDATNGRLSLVGSTTAGEAEQEVTNASAVEHVLKFQVLGIAGDSVTLRVGTATGGSQLKSFTAFVGYHTIAFTATAANFFVQFAGPTDKTVQIDNVSLIDDSPIELTTPYAEADLYEIEGPQSADVLYQFHNSYPTYKMERRGNTTWSFVEVAFQDGPYLDTNTEATTLTPAATTGKGINVTASSITGINGDTGFQSTDVGRLIRIDNPASGVDWGWAVITSVTSTTVVVVDIKRDFATTNADANWRIGAWSATTGYPGAATFFEQRLYTGNNGDQPQTFWASQTDDFENFTPDSDPSTAGVFDGTVEDDDAITYTLAADDINAIFWLTAGEDSLSIGTSGGVWIPSSNGAAITPLDIAVKRQVTSKAAQIQPVRVDNVVLFPQKAKRKLLEFSFTFETDGFKSANMTRLAQHITKGGIVEIDYAEEPDSVVWVVRNDGALLSMTFRRDEDVVGWARHFLGGQFAGGNTVTATDISFTASQTISSVAKAFRDFKAGDILLIDGSGSNDFADIGYVTIDTVSDDHGTITIVEETAVTEAAGASITITAMSEPVVESVATIPGADDAGQVFSSNDRDEVWLQVKRTINGATVRTVEFLEGQFETGDTQADAFYVDSGITYDGVSTTSITGLTHLEGETVRVWADGAIQPDKVVTSGAITIETAAKKVQTGLPYGHILKTLRFEGGNPSGTSVGKTQRVYNIGFILLNCHTLKVGPALDDLTPVTDFREVDDSMDEAVPLFTGSYSEEFDGDWDDDPRIFIKSDDPAPFTLLAMAPERSNNALK